MDKDKTIGGGGGVLINGGRYGVNKWDRLLKVKRQPFPFFASEFQLQPIECDDALPAS
jgi:hypothetical protein